MSRFLTLLLVIAASVGGAGVAEAQKGKKVPRIGYLTERSAPAEFEAAFKQGLRDLGWFEGRNVAIERRRVEGGAKRYLDAATELVGAKVDLIVAWGRAATTSAKQATSTIPIVFMSVGDPVESGLVKNLADPGGNVTGLSYVTVELSGRRMELLKQAVPKVSRVIALVNPTNPGSRFGLEEAEVAGHAVDVTLHVVNVGDPGELEQAFSATPRKGVGGLIVLPDPLFVSQRKEVVRFAAKRRLPTMYPGNEFVDAGGLMAYSQKAPDLFRGAAAYADKILKGAKPADLPVEQPAKFEFVVNLKATKRARVTIPPDVLALADRVIK